MSTIISRTKAKRLTIIYQAAAALFLLLAIGLGVIGLPESATVAQIDQVAQAPSTNSSVNPPVNNNSSEIVRTTPRVDAGSIAARFSLLDNAPVNEVISDPITPAYTPPEVSDDSGMLLKRIRYTGYISDDQQPLAFLRIDGIQRIVAQGGVARAGSMGLDDLTIKAVRPKFILVTDGQVEDRIELASKTGPSISMSGGADIDIPTIPTREEDVVLTPEELEQLNAMPARQRAIRETMLRRQKVGKDPAGSEMKEPQASYRSGFGNSRRNQNSNNN